MAQLDWAIQPARGCAPNEFFIPGLDFDELQPAFDTSQALIEPVHAAVQSTQLYLNLAQMLLCGAHSQLHVINVISNSRDVGADCAQKLKNQIVAVIGHTKAYPISLRF
jgi:hypothetical protein